MSDTPKNSRRSLGQRGEQMAADHLRANGLEIVDTNWRPSKSVAALEARGELDIVAREKDALVFVEVRTRRADPGMAEQSFGPAKSRQVLTLARVYLQAHNIREDAIPWRIDLIAITLSPAGPQLNWIQHAVTG